MTTEWSAEFLIATRTRHYPLDRAVTVRVLFLQNLFNRPQTDRLPAGELAGALAKTRPRNQPALVPAEMCKSAIQVLTAAGPTGVECALH